MLVSGRIVVLAVTAIILAHTLCAAHSMPLAARTTTPREQSSCHGAFPHTPARNAPNPSKPAPSSGESCCASLYYQEAILAPSYDPAVHINVSLFRSRLLFNFTDASSNFAKNAIKFLAFPYLLVLRI